MRGILPLAGAVSCWLALAPNVALTQQTDGRDKAEDYTRETLWGLFGPSYNLSIHGGISTAGRFLLQRADVPAGNFERELSSNGGWNVGGALGVDILPRVGARLNYTYGSTNLAFRTDEGDGTSGGDFDDLGRLESHLASIELLAYMLPARSAITPYFGPGLVATWWVLNQESDIVQPTGGRTQFALGAIAVIGLQVKLADRWDVRAEATSASVRNPFTGRESYTAFQGITVDEPSRVTKRDFKLMFMYNFSKPQLEPSVTNGQR